MVKYENIIKAMEITVVKPQKIYEAIHPIMKMLFPKDQLKKEYRLPEKMPYTDEEYNADLAWYEDYIIEHYRKYCNRGKNNSPMTIIRTDGAKPHSTPENKRLMYPNGETINGNAETFGIRNELFLRNTMTPEGEDPLYSNQTDLQYQARHNIRLMVKYNPTGMTLTKLEGEIDSEDVTFNKIIKERDIQSYMDFENMKRDNGLEELLIKMNDKEIPPVKAMEKVKELYVNETNRNNINKITEFLNQTFKDNDIPITTYYVKLMEETI